MDNSINDEDILKKLEAIDRKYLHFQFVDFLKDFGRSEPFLLDGDALVTYALSDKSLDWQNGGQFLHAAFTVERFLENLSSRGAKFQVFFLLGNDRLFSSLGKSYLLCRKVIMEHLKQSQSTSAHCLKVHFIQGSWFSENSDSWTHLLECVQPVFIMSNNVCSLHVHVALLQRWFVLRMLISGKYVVVLDGFKTEGSRMKTFLFNPPFPSRGTKIKEYISVFEARFSEIDTNLAGKMGIIVPVIPLIDLKIDPAVQDTITSIYIQSLQLLMREGKKKAIGFAAICFLCLEIMRQLPLTARTFVLPGDHDHDLNGRKYDVLAACKVSAGFRTEVMDFLDQFHELIYNIIDQIHCQDTSKLNAEGNLADIFDGRLFHILLLQSITGYIPPQPLLTSAMKHFSFACFEFDEGLNFESAVALLGASEADVEAVRFALDKFRLERTEEMAASEMKLRQVGAKESLLTAVLGDVRDVMMQFEAADDQHILDLGPFIPHHYHNLKPLNSEPDSFSYDVELRKISKRARQSMKQVDRERQKKSLAKFNFQESLLVGTPIKQQLIADTLRPKDLENLRKQAETA